MPFNNYVTRPLLIICVLVVINTLLIPCGEANTPWGLIAGRVIGRVHQLSQKPKDDQPGFDVATVILNANAIQSIQQRSACSARTRRCISSLRTRAIGRSNSATARALPGITVSDSARGSRRLSWRQQLGPARNRPHCASWTGPCTCARR